MLKQEVTKHIRWPHNPKEVLARNLAALSQKGDGVTSPYDRRWGEHSYGDAQRDSHQFCRAFIEDLCKSTIKMIMKVPDPIRAKIARDECVAQYHRRGPHRVAPALPTDGNKAATRPLALQSSATSHPFALLAR